MKFLIVAAVVALAILNVKAHGDDFGFGGFDIFGSSSLDSLESSGARRCLCGTNARNNPCRGRTGTVTLGCPGTNGYLQCVDTTCSTQTCPSGQVWNKTLNACAACATGMHVSANLQVCVCDQGTTYNKTSRSCVACPTGATIEADRCYCPTTMVLDRTKFACKTCPADSTLTRDGCRCTNRTLFWNEAAWACQACPGEWTPKAVRRNQIQVCTCTGANAIFDRQSVSCYTCPSTTTASRGGDSCLCNLRGQWFNMATKTCVCMKGMELNAAGTACQWIPATTTAAAALNP